MFYSQASTFYSLTSPSWAGLGWRARAVCCTPLAHSKFLKFDSFGLAKDELVKNRSGTHSSLLRD